MFSFLLTWYNLPFLIALGGCILLALIQVIGGLGDTEADADVDADIDVDVDAHLDASADLPQAHTGHGHEPSGLLTALGIQRVPLAIVLMALLGSFGAVGLVVNTLLSSVLGGYPPPAFLIVLIVAGALALMLTKRSSGLLGRAVSETSTAVSFEQLVGRVGIVSSTSVSSTYGRVRVRDNHGSVHTVYAIIERGDPLPEHSEVALVAYDQAQRRFLVRLMEGRKP